MRWLRGTLICLSAVVAGTVAVGEEAGSHWAYQSISDPALPQIRAAGWLRNGIDHFILRKLESEGVEPSPEAERAALIRRLYLDLIGLPPSPDEWGRWMGKSEAGWYAELVEELLASPHYGERWARFWLDQARYADSDGYEKDQPRPHAYRWRDWVIGAFNRDLPFDQFTEQQLAGDLLPGATEATRLATGFHRNTLTNREGGIDKEEDRVKQVVDRVNTTASVWLGLSVKCAQCHDHKYDAISQAEYYQLYDFFNSTDEQDFALEPNAEEKRAFDEAMSKHERELSAAKAALEAVRGEVVARLPAICESLLKAHREGAALAVPRDGLLAHRSFESEGDKVPTREGLAGRALSLDGKGQRFVLGSIDGFDEDAAFTLGAWIRRDGESGGVITHMNEHAHFRGIDFTIHRGMVEVHLVDTWPSNAIKVTTQEPTPKGEWAHALMTYDGSKKASGVAIYVNGIAQELKVHFDSLSGSFAIDEPWRVGSRKTGTYFKGQIDEVCVYDRVLVGAEISRVSRDPRLGEVLAAASVPSAQRGNAQTTLLVDHALRDDEMAQELRGRVDHLSKNFPKQQHGTAMGLAQRESPRRTFIHERGVFLDRGAEVRAATPKVLHPLRTRGARPDRLDLARWILDPANTLMPRVMVNRFWQQYFGRGIVVSDDEFGEQGQPPSHPQLLDWLATRFVKGGWSMKQLHRTIVSSATYRQSSVVRRELEERDPYNEWCAFQYRKRVDAEIVRDLALHVSGLLEPKVGGPSVFPPLPPGVIELAFVDVINRGPWRGSEGGDRYRRGLYTFFQRTSPYPMLSLFDAPESTVTCTRRERSNTPLQALSMWNDPVMMECARGLAGRIVERDWNTRLRHAMVIALSREPNDEEVATLEWLYLESLKLYQSDPDLTTAAIASQPMPDGIAEHELAAWIAVARSLLNLDEFITRE